MSTKEVSASRLQALRGKRSREVIAHELRKLGHGTDAKAIWRYETGRNQPSARVLSDYAGVLGVPVEELFGDPRLEPDDDDEEESEAMIALVRSFLAVMRQELKVPA